MGLSEAVQETSLVVWNFSKLNVEGEAPPTCLEPTLGFLSRQRLARWGGVSSPQPGSQTRSV